MSSHKAACYRRRSLSASARYILSPASLTTHSRKVASLKRSYGLNPSTPLNDRSSRRKSDASSRRRSKRRLRNLSVCSDTGPLSAQGYLRSAQTIFATTADDFDLPLAKGYRKSISRRTPTQSSSSSFMDVSDNNFGEACNSHSIAFWDLQRSVAEGGEGLIHRMREHEHVWSNRGVGERGRPALRSHSLSPTMPSTSHPWPHSSTTSDESDDDDIQIIYGNGAQSESTRRDVQMDNWPSTTTGSISSHLVSTTTAGAPSPSVAPALTPSGASIMNAKDSDHTLAAITLAFANGAGSINDYASIVHSDPHHNGFSHDAGDLWR